MSLSVVLLKRLGKILTTFKRDSVFKHLLSNVIRLLPDVGLLRRITFGENVSLSIKILRNNPTTLLLVDY